MRKMDLIGREVYDPTGVLIGVVDKIWKIKDGSECIGVRGYENIRDTWFRGTTKLIPITLDKIKDAGDSIIVKDRLEELSKKWRRVAPCGETNWPIDDLIERVICDKDNRRIGILLGWLEDKNGLKQYSCLLDPFICEEFDLPFDTLHPIPIKSLQLIRDTIKLNETLDNLINTWRKDIEEKLSRKTNNRKKTKNQPRGNKSKRRRVSSKSKKI